MPIPRHSVALPSVQLAAQADCAGVTELRVHGVGGSPPDAMLGDLAPEQVSGDAIAGFYIFFFSSRRRHTRLTCDWSSDVCSSDLLLAAPSQAEWRHTRGTPPGR